jgi:hypothetical protein
MALLDLYKNSIANKITVFLCSFLIICVAGFRYGLETDYWSYYNIFNNRNLSRDTGIEWGYRYINIWFRTYISQEFNHFVTFCSLVFIGIKVWLFSKFNRPLLALAVYFLLFFIFFELNAVRQGIAIAWIFLAVHSLSRNNIRKYFVYTIIAVLIHISSVLLFLVLAVKNSTFTLKKICIILLCTLFFRLFFFEYVLNSILVIIFNIFQTPLFERIQILLTRYFNNDIKMIFSIGMLRKVIFMFLLFLLNRGKKINNIYFNIYLLNVIMSILFSGISTVGYRLSLGFESFLPFAVVTCLRKNTWKQFYTVFFIVLLSFGVYLLTLSNNDSAVPYKTYLLAH